MLVRPLLGLLLIATSCFMVMGVRQQKPLREPTPCAKGPVWQPGAGLKAIGGASVPSNSPPIRHSRPGAARILYLDFTGEVVTGTQWNTDFGAASYTCKPYDRDSDTTTFSAIEQAEIITIWERVSEDYAPFQIDVTTEAPAANISLANTTTAWVLITDEQDALGTDLPHKDAGGVAYLNIFGTSGNALGLPAWVNGTMTAESIADAASHEVGHNLGLHHDGSATIAPKQYYFGHSGGGVPSWGPIMGAPYGKDMSQWSKGDYKDSRLYLTPTQADAVVPVQEDDLAIISGKLPYVADDHGGSGTTATVLTPSGTGAVSASGLISTTGDKDCFKFTVKTRGTLDLHIDGYRDSSGTGGNLDLLATLTNFPSGSIVSNNPGPSGDADINRVVNAGTYVLVVTPVGAGDPLASTPTGYTSYGVLGRYTISGNVHAAAPSVSNGTLNAFVGEAVTFTVTSSDVMSFTAGALPAGLGFDIDTGIISGTPTTLGTSTVTVTGTNSLGTDLGFITVNVAALPVPTVTDASTSGTIGTPMLFSVTSTHVATFSATGLPPGLSINASTGSVTGTPTTEGTFVATVTGTNTAGSANGAYTFSIAAAPTPPASSAQGGDPGTTCGSGSGIAAILGLFAGCLLTVRRRRR